MSFKYALGRRSLGALAAITASIVSLAGASETRADIIQIASDSSASTSSLGEFTGSIDYAFSGALNSWAVTITLTNTSPAGNGGAITAFLFNIDSTDSNASATLNSSTNGNFVNVTNGNGAPYGSYDAGAGLANNFQGGGSPSLGVQVGQSATWVFTVSASDAASLTAVDFISGPNAYNFIVRFRGFDNNGSDKVPALVTVVPGPSALCAIALGLVMMKKRRRSA